MAGMSVGGLVSGLDTNSIIAQLTALEQMKVTRENQKKENAQKTLDKFKELQTRLGNLSSKANTLETQNKFNVFKSNSNFDDYVSISGKEGATAGQYDVEVRQLATSQKVASNKISAINTPVAPDAFKINGTDVDTIKITLSKTQAAAKTSKDSTVDVVISKADTLKDIVNKINAAEGASVKASIMSMADGDNRLILTAVETGTKGFTISENGGTSLLKTLGILSSTEGSVALSGNALVTKTGGATKDTTFDELNTSPLLKTVDYSKDSMGIYIVTGKDSVTNEDIGKWITTDLVKQKLDENGDPVFKDGNPVLVSKTVEEAINDLNDKLAGDPETSLLRAGLNNSGEITISRVDGSNMPSDMAKGFKIKIGEFDFSDPDNIEIDEKRDLGKFTTQNTFANVITEAQNAFYSIDNMAISSRSNSDDKTINGTVFNLKKITIDEDGRTIVGPVKTSLSLDKDAIIGNINAFVEEFNALMKFLDENMKTIVKEDTDKVSGRKTTTREIGPFAGDTSISTLRDNLKRMLTGVVDEITGTKNNGYSTLYSSASRIGITTQKDGALKIDTAQLTKALDTDFDGVRRLFTSNNFSDEVGFSVGNSNKKSQAGIYKITADGDVFLNGNKMAVKDIFDNKIITLENGLSFETPSLGSWGDKTEVQVTFVRGIASQIANFVEKAKDAADGYYKTSEKNYQARIDSIQKRVDELQIRVDNYNTRISKQFAALERNMSNLQSQTANMMSALSGITYRSRN